ncbi:MAG: TolC family outer membrane protein [Burkholderiaceae bacterium]
MSLVPIILPLLASAQDLQSFYNAAMENDPQWLAAKHALEAARQRPGMAQSALWPQLSFAATRHEQTGSLHYAEEDPVHKDVQARNRELRLTQGLIRPEQWAAVRQANAQEAQALAQYDVARQQLAIRLAQAYLDAWVAQESVHLTAAQLKAYEGQLALARDNYQVGTTTISDVHEAQAQRDLGQAQVISAALELQRHATELRRMTGRTPATLHGVREDAPSPTVDLEPLSIWLDRAVQLRPEVLVAQAGVHVADREQDRRRSSFLPTLDLAIARGTDRSSGSVTAPTDTAYRNRITRTTLTLNWPLFEGGRSYYQMREAAAAVEQAEAELDLARGEAGAIVRQAYAGLVSGRAQIRALLSARTSSLKALEASQVGYRIGTRINLDVLNAQSQYANVQRDLVRARAEVVLHWLRLQAAAGRLGPESMARVNAWLDITGSPVDLNDISIDLDTP